MGGMMYSILASTGLVSLGIYHLICSIYGYLTKSTNSYSAKPYHPFPPFSSSSSSNPSPPPHSVLSPPTTSTTITATGTHNTKTSWLKHLPLYLVILCLAIAALHQTLAASDSDPLLKGRTPVHRFTSLQSSAVLLLFLILSLSLFFSPDSPLPSDLFFSLLSASFLLQSWASYSSASVQTSALQAHLDSLSSYISALSSFLCLSLAFNPRLFVSDVALGGSLVLQGLWALQSGLSLYVDAFIPEGCHRLLDVVGGVEGSTKCDLEDSVLRAVAILDLVLVLHVALVFLIVMVVYGVVAKSVGVGGSSIKTGRMGSYEALPTSDPSAINHSIQMKTLTGTQA